MTHTEKKNAISKKKQLTFSLAYKFYLYFCILNKLHFIHRCSDTL